MNIAVIFGGNSVEHEVSIITANQILTTQTKYNLIPVYVSKQNNFYSSDSFLDIKTFNDLDKVVSTNKAVNFQKKNQKVVLSTSGLMSKSIEIDAAINCMHGGLGESGSISGFLDTFDLAYSSSSVLGASVGQDKVVMKDILKANGFKQTNYRVAYKHMDIEQINELCLQLNYPVIIKPANLGSSVGISIVKDQGMLETCFHEAFKYDRKVVIEEFISDFREINMSVLVNTNEMICSSSEEVFGEDEVLSYQDKYLSGSKSSKGAGMANVKRQVPANIDEKLVLKMEEIVKNASMVLNVFGVVRYDLMLVDNEIYINEVNTIPGSLSFYLWINKGISTEMLVTKLVEGALNRKREEKMRIASFETSILSNFSGSKGSKNGTKA